MWRNEAIKAKLAIIQLHWIEREDHILPSHIITFKWAEQTNKVNCSFLAVCFTSKSNSPMSTMLMFLFVGDLAWVHWLWGIYSKALKGESQCCKENMWENSMTGPHRLKIFCCSVQNEINANLSDLSMPCYLA